MQELNAVDLFSGAGGLGEGFKQAGFKIICAAEKWEPACRTYAMNHPETPLIRGDLTYSGVRNRLYKIVGDKHVHVVFGGPPCQSYSIAGRRDEKDPRGKLFLEFIKIVDKLQPDYFLFENVEGLMSMKFNDENLMDVIIHSFNEIGYKCDYKLLNAVDYGVPQKRKRVFIIGSKKGRISFPKPTHTEYISAKEVIGKYEDMEEDHKFSHIFTKHTQDFLKKVRETEQGKNMNKYRESYWRLLPDEPSRTVMENHGSVFLHYKFDRCCTPRELAAFQSFGDHYKFYGSKSDVLVQIGNAVPPRLAEALAERLKFTIGILYDKT